jgi:outer membrane protein OmpA-like peptidoglycan-associated protein
MQRMRTGLLIAVAAPLLAAAPALFGQVGPTITGETGLFELKNAETVPVGQFSFGLSYSHWAKTAAPSLVYSPQPDDPLRYSTGRLGIAVAYGLGKHWEASLVAGPRTYWADDQAWAGSINGYERYGSIRRTESDKLRFGTKVLMTTKDPVKVALIMGVSVPLTSRSDAEALSTYRADWDLGMSFNYKAFTFQTGYLLAGDRGSTFDVSNQLMFGIGFNIKIIPGTLAVITELNRIHFDGGDSKPDDHSEALLGARLALGESGFSTAGAVRANIDMWHKYGTSASPIGYVLQVAYSPQPVIAAKPKVAAQAEEPAPAPATAPPPAPAPAPVVEAPQSPKGETSTTDEILFDPAKNRLTNIAKAILDGVALRLKNNLSAICTISGYADPGEKAKDKAALASSRADAAKDYLVKRHGIDASRITVETKAEPLGSDPTRNRAAIVQVSFR